MAITIDRPALVGRIIAGPEDDAGAVSSVRIGYGQAEVAPRMFYLAGFWIDTPALRFERRAAPSSPDVLAPLVAIKA